MNLPTAMLIFKSTKPVVVNSNQETHRHTIHGSSYVDDSRLSFKTKTDDNTCSSHINMLQSA